MGYITYFLNLCKRLNINMNFQCCADIFDNNRDFHWKCYRQYINTNKNKKNQIQYGGTKKIKYTYDNYTFTIFKDIEDDRVTYSVHCDDNIDLDMCMMLFVEQTDRYVYIDNISYYDNCIKNGMPKTRGGTLLLNMTLDFIKKVLKPEYNLKYIQLRDTSRIYCQKNKTHIDFDSFYMLTHGNTWYGKNGFIPFDDKKIKINKKVLREYKENQKLIETKIKDTNMEKFLKEVKGVNMKAVEKLINNSQNISIQKFMKSLSKNFIESCHIIESIYKKIMVDVGMHNLHGEIYFMTI